MYTLAVEEEQRQQQAKKRWQHVVDKRQGHRGTVHLEPREAPRKVESSLLSSHVQNTLTYHRRNRAARTGGASIQTARRPKTRKAKCPNFSLSTGPRLHRGHICKPSRTEEQAVDLNTSEYPKPERMPVDMRPIEPDQEQVRPNHCHDIH